MSIILLWIIVASWIGSAIIFLSQTKKINEMQDKIEQLEKQVDRMNEY